MRAFFYLDCKLEFFVCYDLFAKTRSNVDLVSLSYRKVSEGDLEIFFENLGKNLIICFSKFYKLTAIFLYKLFFSNLRVRMKGIAISPHILTLKPEPFTPLKRLGTPQTPVKNEENLV